MKQIILFLLLATSTTSLAGDAEEVYMLIGLKADIENLIEKKKSMTDKAVDLLLKKLYKLSDDEDEQIEILNQSIINGWTGIYPLKNNYTKPTKEDDDDYDDTFVDLRKEMGI